MDDIVEMFKNEKEHYENAYVDGIIKGRIIALGKKAKKIDEKYIMSEEERDSIRHAFFQDKKLVKLSWPKK